MTTITTHRDLIVWQRSMDLVIEIYRVTGEFPREEIYGLTSQMRRASVSIPCNIAEGRRRSTKKDYRHFLQIAFGSGAELETQVEIVERLRLISKGDKEKIASLLTEIMKMLNTMIARMV